MEKKTPIQDSHSQKNSRFHFHPFEIAFCGYSHSGKTTLITKLIHQLSPPYKICYIKHDVHSFTMDHEGKDTFRARESGARTVLISDADRVALLASGQTDPVVFGQAVLENDFAFIEGYKRYDTAKFIVVDGKGEILEQEQKEPFRNVLGYIVDPKNRYAALKGQAVFDRDDVEGIKGHILSYWEKSVRQIPLYGLVLAGGKSTRMKKDKSLLEYHGRKQAVHCFHLLSEVCDQVFVSNRQGQAALMGHKVLPQIHDTFLDIGPLGGILTAMTQFPEAAWLVLACDLPFVDKGVLENLLRQRNPFKMATAYQSSRDPHLPEPLCAVYEPKAVFRILQFLAQGIHCPRTILKRSDTHLLPQPHESALDNVNTPDEYQKAVDFLHKKNLSEV